MAEPEQARELMAQLTEAREAFRKDIADQAAANAKFVSRKKQIERLHIAARAEKLRIRKMYRRFLAHMKRKWSAERLAVQNERRELVRERTELDRTAAESQDYQQQLYAAWEQLQEGQRRLLAERQQAELWLAKQTDTLDHRAQTLDQHERQFSSSRDDLEAKLHGLRDEIAGLDARAANARITIEQLELKQSRLLVPADGFGDPMAVSLVPLSSPSTSTSATGSDADGLLVDLHSRQQDLDRVRRKIFAARDEIERQTTNLDDQRAVLGEQVATLVAARELWNAAELATLDEMESLAKAMRIRERGLELREQELIEAERLSGERERELWDLRERLNTWRQALAAHEAAGTAALESGRKHLKWREETLSEITQTWNVVRERERQHYLGVVEHLEAECAKCESAAADAERDRKFYAEEIARVAALQLALEEAIAEKGQGSERKIRILRAHWEKRFKLWEKRLETGHEKLKVATANAQQLQQALQTTMTRWLEGRASIAEVEQKRDRLTEMEPIEITPVPALNESTEQEATQPALSS